MENSDKKIVINGNEVHNLKGIILFHYLGRK